MSLKPACLAVDACAYIRHFIAGAKFASHGSLGTQTRRKGHRHPSAAALATTLKSSALQQSCLVSEVL